MKRLGDILLEAGVLDADQMNLALREKRAGERLGAALVRLGMVSEDLMVRALAKNLNLAVVDVSQIAIPADLAALIPQQICDRFLLLPVAIRTIAGRSTVILAMADPTQKGILQMIENRLEYAVRPALAAETAIIAALERTFGPPAPGTQRGQEVEFEEAAKPPSQSSPPANEPVLEERDTEITRLTRNEVTVDEADAKALATLTEPTEHGFRLPAPPAPTVESKVRATPPNASLVSKGPVLQDLRDIVQQTNKNVLLESLVSVLLDRKIFSLEDLLAALELRK